MMRFTHGYLCVVFLFCTTFCIGQTLNIDSLKNVIDHTSDPQKKRLPLFVLLKHGQSLHTDSFYRYALMARQVSIQNKNQKDAALAGYYIAHAMQAKGFFDSAMQIITLNLQKLKNDTSYTETFTRFNNLKAQVLIKKKEYKSAMRAYFEQLAEAEKVKDTLTQIIARSGIGWIHMEMDQPANAIPWFIKAINTSTNEVHLKRLSPVYSNLAASYNALHQNDAALPYIDTAIRIAKAVNNLTALANSLNIQANIFIEKKQNQQAEKILQEAIAIRRKIGDPFFIVSDMSQLAILYRNNGEPQKGIAIAKEGIAMADSLHINAKLPLLYEALAQNYKAAGNFEDYGITLQKIINIKDSLYKINSAEAMAELNAKYDVQKKENLIITQKLDLVRKNTLLYAVTAATIFLIIISALIFVNYKKRQKIKLGAIIERGKLLSYQAAITAEENERKRIAADLHDNLGAYAAAISSNIDQLDKNQNEKDHITLRELRANSGFMVSMLSDTVWALKKDALPLTAISDRLKVFIQRLECSHPGITIDVKEEIDEDFLLPPLQAFHLSQVLQEAVNNALKHSDATNIVVDIQTNANWQISIADNGKGMIAETGSITEGSGLSNMKNRAAISGWQISWKKNMPTGTVVNIHPEAVSTI
jgi:signal transduction histidine kinase